MRKSNTIFALATPFAKSGVAVVRLSGPDSLSALTALTEKSDWAPNAAHYAAFRTPDGKNIDSGLALYFKAPKSFTGEDVAEFHVHGSLGVIRELLEVLSKMEGLRHAEPGEFTRRAFLNGKLDLLEAEGLADLIEAETPAQKAQALAQMQGAGSRYYESLRTQMTECLALLEATIDFPDEEIPASVLTQVKERVAHLQGTIRATLADNRSGERTREGFRAVILGAPNVGKSSLLNALAGRDAAIVSHRAGTTRDVIEVHLNIGGFPVILTDTAGIRETGDDIEEEGVRRALKSAKDADITLLVFDATVPGSPAAEILSQATDKSLLIANKLDLTPDAEKSKILIKNNMLYVSAQTGEGVDTLLSMLKNKISDLFSNGSQVIITRSRHRTLLEDALVALERFSLDNPVELTCEELRLAADAVGRITGKIAVDDVLDVVFKSFCIGK